jgi:hypothetical protein
MSPSRPGVPRMPAPDGAEPLEAARARGMLAGLLIFGLGTAVAGVLSWLGYSHGALYVVVIALAFVGLAVLAVFVERGTVPLPPGPIWAPSGLGMVARSVGLPALVVQVLVYGLILVGVAGNIVVPLVSR